jgi:hypothetical protein
MVPDRTVKERRRKGWKTSSDEKGKRSRRWWGVTLVSAQGRFLGCKSGELGVEPISFVPGFSTRC